MASSSQRMEQKMVPLPDNAETVYTERYNLLKDIVYELEDENDLIALKIAQFEQRVEALKRARTNGVAEQPHDPSPKPPPVETIAAQPILHPGPTPERRPDPRTDSIFSSQPLPQYPGHIPTPPPPPISSARHEDVVMNGQ